MLTSLKVTFTLHFAFDFPKGLVSVLLNENMGMRSLRGPDRKPYNTFLNLPTEVQPPLV